MKITHKIGNIFIDSEKIIYFVEQEEVEIIDSKTDITGPGMMKVHVKVVNIEKPEIKEGTKNYLIKKLNV